MVNALSTGEILISGTKVASVAAAERFRMIRAKIERKNMSGGSKLELINVTSALAEEGKSITSVNLSRALSLDPYGKTLLVDCDFRRPSVSSYFNLKIEPGLSDALYGKQSLPSVIRNITDRLDVVTAGSYLSDPTQAIESPRLREFLQLLKQRYRYVVVDCPPVLLCPEPITLSDLCDGTLMVVRGWRTDKHLVKDAVSVIGREKIKGIILNDIEDVSGEYLQYGYYSPKRRAEIEKAKEVLVNERDAKAKKPGKN